MAKRKVNHQWDRVKATEMDPAQKKRQERIEATLRNRAFIKTCLNTKKDNGKALEITRRQASKWNRNMGATWKHSQGVNHG